MRGREEATWCSTRWGRRRCSTRTCCVPCGSVVISWERGKGVITTGLVVVGFSGGEIQRIPANHLLVKNVSAVGIYLGGYLKNKPAVVQGVGESVASEA